MPCIASRRTILGAKPPKKNFNESTWEEISAVCKAGLASEYWAIGDTKNMIDGDTTTALRIIGFDHDYVSDIASYGREKAGITLELVESNASLNAAFNSVNYTSAAWYHTNDTYHSTCRKTLLPNYLANVVPDDLRGVIVPVGKEFMYKDTSVLSSVSDTLFILSVNEITGGKTSGFQSEGTQYAYYAAGNSKIKRTTDGTAVDAWTRSPYSSSSWAYLSASGTVSRETMTVAKYIFPAMCI